MSRNNKKYDKTQIENSVEKSTSYSDVFRNLGISINGGSYKWLKNIISKFGIDTSHFLSLSDRGKMMGSIATKNTDIRLYSSNDISNGERIQASKLRKFMLYHKISEECNICKLNDWLYNPIRLDIDHIDENSVNNHIDNLQFICPNCHRQKTIKFEYLIQEDRIEKRKIVKKTYNKNFKPKLCSTCSVQITRNSFQCMSCSKTGLFKIEWPDKDILEKLLWEKPTIQIGKDLGVSDKAVEKHVKKLGLTKPPRGYWQKIKKYTDSIL